MTTPESRLPPIPEATLALVKPGDTLVVGLTGPDVPEEDARRVHDNLMKFLPGTVKVAVILNATVAVVKDSDDG